MQEYLSGEGYHVLLCKNGKLAIEAFQSGKFQACLLDVMMPEIDGFSLATEIRKINSTVPLLFITARSLKQDKLKAYQIGADDYITKPFDEEELLWKLKVLMRRSICEPKVISIGKYELNPELQALIIEGSVKRITEKECDILKYLVNNRNTIVKREVLLQAVWGSNDYFLGRSLDVFITKIRKYLSEDANINIENVFGVGFILNVK